MTFSFRVATLFRDHVVIMDFHGNHDLDVDMPCSARRRRERRLCALFRHEKLTVAMTIATVLHHTREKGTRVDKKGLLDAATQTLDFFDIDTDEDELLLAANQTIENVNQPTSEMHVTPTHVLDVPWFSERNCEQIVHAPVPHIDTQKVDEPKISILRTMADVRAPPVTPAPVIEYVTPSRVTEYVSPALDVTCPALVIEHVEPASAVTYTAFSTVIEYVAPAPAVTHEKPSPVIEYATPAPSAAPAPVTEYVAPAHPVIEYVVPSPVIEYIAPAPAATCFTPSQQFLPRKHHGSRHHWCQL